MGEEVNAGARTYPDSQTVAAPGGLLCATLEIRIRATFLDMAYEKVYSDPNGAWNVSVCSCYSNGVKELAGI